VKTVLIPDIGTDEAVEVIEVSVKVGDTIAKEDSLITLESEKASMEVPASDAGVVKNILVKLGDKVTQGTPILELEEAQQSAAEPDSDAEPNKEPSANDGVDRRSTREEQTTAPKQQNITIPDIGTDEAVEIIEVAIKVGDEITKEQTLVTLESEKASMDVPSPVRGKVLSIDVKQYDKVKKGDLIATVSVETSAASKTAPQTDDVGAERKSAQQQQTTTPARVPETEPAQIGGRVYASPSVRRLARELGVELTQVGGTGRKGRIQKLDLQNFVKRQLAGGGSSTSSGNALPSMPKVDFTKFGEVEEKPLSRVKKFAATNLHRNWVNIPHVTQFDEADITDLEEFRKSQKERAEAQGFKLTPLVFLMKAVVAAIKQFPQFNSSLSADGQALIMKKYFHIGVAVETPEGLVVPVIRDVDKKGLFELAKELGEVSQKAREGTLAGRDMQGSCFTISSLGGIGGTAFTPIVNAPDVAILGVSRSALKPVYKDGEFVPRLMLPLSLSYDHRVIDGAEAARFTTFMSGLLADLRRIML
jgi:pyruvate dehydrogenase E2 component (dihydrolipoamide acetyltransferase)